MCACFVCVCSCEHAAMHGGTQIDISSGSPQDCRRERGSLITLLLPPYPSFSLFPVFHLLLLSPSLPPCCSPLQLNHQTLLLLLKSNFITLERKGRAGSRAVVIKSCEVRKRNGKGRQFFCSASDLSHQLLHILQIFLCLYLFIFS